MSSTTLSNWTTSQKRRHVGFHLLDNSQYRIVLPESKKPNKNPQQVQSWHFLSLLLGVSFQASVQRERSQVSQQLLSWAISYYRDVKWQKWYQRAEYQGWGNSTKTQLGEVPLHLGLICTCRRKKFPNLEKKHWKGVDVINPGAPTGLGRVCVQTRKGRKPTKYIKHWAESSEEY